MKRLELASSSARDVCVQYAIGSDGSGLGPVRPVGPVQPIRPHFPHLSIFQRKRTYDATTTFFVHKSIYANTN